MPPEDGFRRLLKYMLLTEVAMIYLIHQILKEKYSIMEIL